MDKPLILVVEDDPTQQRLMHLLADRIGYRAHVVSHSQELQGVLDTTPIDKFALVLMDWKLIGDELDGAGCAKMIRQREVGTASHIPIIATTAHALVGDRERCLEAGMDDYLSKPFTIDAFQEVFNKWLDKSTTAY